MTLSPGTRLGSYEIVAALGSGGMGEVYRARDTRLGRDVAIKVLARRLAGDPKAQARFEREARAVAALSHPNVLALFDCGESDGVAFAVLELLEGETLRARLAAEPLAQRKAVEYGVQIARGLAAAHDRGIVHRDLKPENVFLTRSGQVKILDFGLALLTAPEAGADPRYAPTLTHVTEPGLVMGTAGYMSPEQVRGQPADERSDLFAFGAILYEMLAGRKAFHGETPSDRMAAILHQEPPDLPASVPPALDRIVRHCLEKRPEERFRSAHDLAFDLETVSGLSSAGSRGAAPVKGRRGRLAPVLLAAAMLALMAGAGLARWLWRDPPAAPVFRQLTFRRGAIHTARFAPDGETVVYGAAWEGAPLQVFAMRTDRPESSPIALPSADLLSVSRSGEVALSLGRRFLTTTYASLGTLARAPLAGGSPREILQGVHEADWAPDGSSLAVVRLDAIGGERRLEYPIGKVLYRSQSSYLVEPRVSPAGDRVAVFEASPPNARLLVFDRSGRTQMALPLQGFVLGLAWHPAREEIWFNVVEKGGGALYAVRPGGEPRLVFRTMGWTQLFDIAPTGKVILGRHFMRFGISGRLAGQERERDLSWFELSVARDLSADGKTLLFTEDGEGAGSGRGTYLRQTDGSPPVHLGPQRGRCLSPDGEWVLARNDEYALFLMPTGAGESRSLPKTTLERPGLLSWFPDGRRVLLAGNEVGGKRRLYVQGLSGGPPRAVTPPGFLIGEAFAMRPLSPDGRQVVAQAPDGRLWIFPLGGGPPRAVTGLQPGEAPLRWSADGRALFVWRRDPGAPARVFRLDLATGRREPWLEIRPPDPAGVYTYTSLVLTPDGRSYAYTYGRLLSELFVIEGLK